MGMIPQRYLCHRARTARTALSTCGGKGETGVGVAVGLAISTGRGVVVGVSVGVGGGVAVAAGTGVSAGAAANSAMGLAHKGDKIQARTSNRSGYFGRMGIPSWLMRKGQSEQKMRLIVVEMIP